MASAVTSGSMARSWKPFKLQIFGSHSHWRRIHAWNTLQDCPDHCSTHKAQGHLGWQEDRPQLKIRLLRSLVMSICLYSRETWTLTAEIERKIQTVEMRSFRRLLGISYKDHINQSINQSNFYSANIPDEARLSGATAKSVFNSKIEETVPTKRCEAGFGKPLDPTKNSCSL